MRRGGNTFRRSQSEPQATPINNLPGRYATEDWEVHYWDVSPWGEVRSRQASIQLPLGYSLACPVVAIGQRGCIHRVRRWGIQLYTRILDDIGFDPTRCLSPSDATAQGADDSALVRVLVLATHFDLPSYFVIASDEHPLLLFDPDGFLKGSYVRWFTHLGALAYLLSGGRVTGSFTNLLSEDPALYQEVLGIALDALRSQGEDEGEAG